MADRTFEEKKTNKQKNKPFFLLNFNVYQEPCVYINLDNRKGARVRYDNGDQFRWKKNMKII